MKKVLAVVGAVAAGFVAGILTAPKSGKETRADIKKKAGELKAEAGKYAKKTKAAAKDAASSLKAGAQKVGDVASETARDVKGNVEKRFK
ncbi:MAG: YtxH domain-containing protein [Candidatus Saccharibacteria bacterium]|nr:YtxH domain-containing protein [Candidatus Saccharibacteria bacterium]